LEEPQRLVRIVCGQGALGQVWDQGSRVSLSDRIRGAGGRGGYVVGRVFLVQVSTQILVPLGTFHVYEFIVNWALGSGHWALGTGHWVLGTGHWALGTGHWALGTGHWALSLGTGHWALGTGHWALGTGHWALSLGTGHWALGTGHWALGTGHWALDTEAEVGVATGRQ
jgi:hypothetical protein